MQGGIPQETMITNLGFSMLQVGVTALGARLIGRLLLRRVNKFPQPALQIAAEAGIGMALVSYLLFLLVLVGAANQTSFSILLGGLLLCAVLDARNLFSHLAPNRRVSRWLLLLLAGGGLYVLALAAWTVLPPTAIDELIYHLEVPRQILQNGGWTFFQDNIYAYFPALGEMFFLLGLGLGGEAAAKLYSELYGILLVVAIFGFARARLSPAFAFLAALTFLSVPSVIQLSSIAYVDLMFAFYAFLAFCGLLAYLEDRSVDWLLLTGLFAGCAWAVKYTGMQYAMLLFVLILLEHLMSRRKKLSPAVILMPLISLAVVSPYLLRNWLVTGWPLFPFNLGPFSLVPDLNWDTGRGRLLLSWLSGFGSGGDLVDKLLAPIQVFVRGEFGDLSRFDGVAGPVFLLTPVLLWFYVKKRESWLMVLFSLLFIYYWAFTTQQVRFLFPVLPLLAYLLAEGLERIGKRPLVLLATALIVWNLMLGVREIVKTNPTRYWSGDETREQYLAARVVGYPLYLETNRVLGTTGDRGKVFLINMRNFGYFLDCPWRADFVFEYFRLGGELEAAQAPGDLLPFFQTMGITHLMIDEAVTLSPRALPAREQNLLGLFLRNHTRMVARNRLREGQTLREITFPQPAASR